MYIEQLSLVERSSYYMYPEQLSFVERCSYYMYPEQLSLVERSITCILCPYLGVSTIGGFTVVHVHTPHAVIYLEGV